jgi:hypothetical protein
MPFPETIGVSRIAAFPARVFIAFILAVPCAAPAGAQRLGQFELDPKSAAAAFYWAARLNPGSAEVLYARRASLLMADDGLRRRRA